MQLRHHLLNFATCAAALVPDIASAVPVLPDAIYSAALQTSQSAQREFQAPGTYVLEGASTTVDATPSLVGHVATAAIGEHGSVASVIHYAFVVDGPVPNIAVPMLVAMSVNASKGGADSSAWAFINVERQFGSFPMLGVQVQALPSNPNPGRVSVTLPFTTTVGAVGGIWMQINLSARGPGAVADALADPYLYVAPAFLATHPGYTVMVSSGIGNTAPVPEPAAVLLFAAGLLVLMVRRMRRVGMHFVNGDSPCCVHQPRRRLLP